jgi:hypothetical protein
MATRNKSGEGRPSSNKRAAAEGLINDARDLLEEIETALDAPFGRITSDIADSLD